MKNSNWWVLLFVSIVLSFAMGFYLAKNRTASSAPGMTKTPDQERAGLKVEKTSPPKRELRTFKSKSYVVRFELGRSEKTENLPPMWGVWDNPEDQNVLVDRLWVQYMPEKESSGFYESPGLYADLANIRFESVRLEEDKPGELKLRFSGADAGASYDCELSFRKGIVTERRVHLGEFPESFAERTIYSDTPIQVDE